MVIIFNWRAVLLVLVGLAAGLGTSVAMLKISSEDAATFAGLAVAGLTLLVVDYFYWRRRQPDGRPMWRLISLAAGGHVFLIPCWLWGGAALLIATLGFGAGDTVQASSLFTWTAIGLVALLVPPVFDLIRPYDSFRWAAREPEVNEAITPR